MSAFQTNLRTVAISLSLAITACGADKGTTTSPPKPVKEPSMTVENPRTNGAEATPSIKVVRVAIAIKPEQLEAFRSYMAKESNVVRAFDGCERYELYASTEVSNGFLLYQEWASAAAFKTFQDSPELAKSFTVLGPMMAGPPESAYFDAVRAE